MGTVNYPDQIDTWTDKQDLIDIYHADDVNTAYARLIRIQETLGINPQGEFSSVAARIASLSVPQTAFLQAGVLDDPSSESFNMQPEIVVSVSV